MFRALSNGWLLVGAINILNINATVAIIEGPTGAQKFLVNFYRGMEELVIDPVNGTAWLVSHFGILIIIVPALLVFSWILMLFLDQ